MLRVAVFPNKRRLPAELMQKTELIEQLFQVMLKAFSSRAGAVIGDAAAKSDDFSLFHLRK